MTAPPSNDAKPAVLGAIFNFKELVPLITRSLNPIQTKHLRESSKLLRASITTEELKAKEQETLARYTRAVQLPSGAFRLTSRFGTHTMDVVAPLTDLVYDGLGPVILHMRLDGVAYVAKAMTGVNMTDGTALWPSNQELTSLSGSNPLFRPGSNILQRFPGGVWISRVDHAVRIFGINTSCTTVHLTLDRNHGRQFKLQLVCIPFAV